MIIIVGSGTALGLVGALELSELLQNRCKSYSGIELYQRQLGARECLGVVKLRRNAIEQVALFVFQFAKSTAERFYLLLYDAGVIRYKPRGYLR